MDDRFMDGGNDSIPPQSHRAVGILLAYSRTHLGVTTTNEQTTIEILDA